MKLPRKACVQMIEQSNVEAGKLVESLGGKIKGLAKELFALDPEGLNVHCEAA